MALFKCSALLKATTASKRSGSWSENYYRTASTVPAAKIALDGFMATRLTIASNAITYIGARIVNLDSPGLSRVIINNPPAFGNLFVADTPWQTVSITAFTAEGNKRVVRFPGVPDDWIKRGAWTPPFGFDSFLPLVMNALVNGGWGMLGADLTNPRVDVISVDGTGAFIFSDNFNGVVNGRVKFFRTRDSVKDPVKGLWTIATLPTTTQGTLRFWKTDRIVKKGKVNLFTRSLKLITACEFNDVTKRNIGKDFFQFVGRRSPRR